MSGAPAAASAAPPAPVLVAFRWWHIEQALVIERDLFAEDAWSAEMFWSELAQLDTHRYVAAVEGGELIGYGGLTAYSGEGYVQTLAVARRAQGRGVGTALLEALLADAARRGAQLVGLEVRTDNLTAQRLYARYGFEVAGVRRGYYQPSGADAFVMLRREGVR